MHQVVLYNCIIIPYSNHLIFTALGNVYIADSSNYRIRKVTIDGTYYPTKAPTIAPT